ncbi:unnamed protein product [Lactuca virosa]|uniref:Uncharacterized protein n=1 Tax=Lactuca virosa TaxID=75947 RepID=A0AAU9NW27_9ASTR|nr:unnamed protein product [Lactuca virosa]
MNTHRCSLRRRSRLSPPSATTDDSIVRRQRHRSAPPSSASAASQRFPPAPSTARSRPNLSSPEKRASPLSPAAAPFDGALPPLYSPPNSDQTPPIYSPVNRSTPPFPPSPENHETAIPPPHSIKTRKFLGHSLPNAPPHTDLLLIWENLIAGKPSFAAGRRLSPPPAAVTNFDQKFKNFCFSREFQKIQPCGSNSSLGCGFSGFLFSNVPETWFLPQELPNDDAVAADDDMQVDPDNADSPFEAEDHYDLPIRQLPPPYPCQASGSHSQPSGEHFQPQHDYHSYQKHNEPDPAHEFPLDIYSQLASLRLQGNAAIHRSEEQQACTNTYMEDLWYHFQPEGGYPPRGPPPP